MIGILSARQIHLVGFFFVHKAFWTIRSDCQTVKLSAQLNDKGEVKRLKNETQKCSVNTTGFKHFEWIQKSYSLLHHPKNHLRLSSKTKTGAMKRNSV